MQSIPHLNTRTHRSPIETDFADERKLDATTRRSAPAVTYRRYPSLSDDGQPYFPRLRRKIRSMEESMIDGNTSLEKHGTGFFSVRAIALSVVVAIIAALFVAA